MISAIKFLLVSLVLMTLAKDHHQLAAAEAGQDDCSSYTEEKCGEYEPPIRFPFSLKNRQHCSYPGFELSCVDNKTALPLPSKKKFLFLIKISYEFQAIQVYSPESSTCSLSSACPLQILISEYLHYPSSDFPFHLGFGSFYLGGEPSTTSSAWTLLDCSTRSRIPCDLHLAPTNSSFLEFRHSLYSCTKMYDINCSFPVGQNYSPWDDSDEGLVLYWSRPDCSSCERMGQKCKLKEASGSGHGETQCVDILTPNPTAKGKSKFSSVISSARFIATIASVSCSLVLAAAIYLYISFKNTTEDRLRIEKFLEDYIALKPSRYSYMDIKKITNQFKDKLGQGAYGTVFKGQLSNDIAVAVKILNNSKGNGEEFLNEVATMGQIHHVNVVRLVGYCAEGLRRALVYEFLPNNSLEKYILPAGGGTTRLLSLVTLHDIALGIAKGIKYLHQECDKRILHFDIKPNNILLDQNLVPKISDFGLAKSCSKDQSVVSMTTARGTMGYIAPEVFSLNFGNVSYKSDVYSFGMLLLEMVGGKKSNTNVIDDNADEIFYPEWIYNLLEEGEDLRIDIEEDGDAKIAKKLAIIGLWCIQWHPIGRPTMKVVVQMLEGGGEVLTMPPNPFASTSSSKSNNASKMPAQRMALELEAISE